MKIAKNLLYEGNNMQLNLINRPQYLNQLLQFQKYRIHQSTDGSTKIRQILYFNALS